MSDWFRAGAALTLFAIIIAVWLYWPLPDLGIETNPETGIVLTVAPNSAAAQGGLLPGDQIVSIYDYPLSAINTRVLLVPLPWREGMTSPLQVQRKSTLIDLTLRPGRPSLALQIDKALRALVALTCWATGMLIATSPQAANRRYQWAAWFWMSLGAALGLLLLVQIVSELLTVAVHWLLCTILAPAAVVMHVWYPGRPIPPAIERRTRRWWLGSMLVLQVLFLGLAIIGQTAYGLHKLLDTATTLAFLTSFVLSAAILWRAYQATTISHVQRQIRLIVWACAIVACAWLILVLGEIAAPQLMSFVPPVTLTIVAVIVPLAYLIGSVNVDLLRVDLLARRLVIEASTLLAITALLAAATQAGFFALTPTLLVVVVIALYRPTQSLIRRAPVLGLDQERPYELLSETTTQLGSTLAVARLATIISDGLRATFRDPPLALYLKRKPRGAVLERIASYRLNPPAVATTQLIEQVFCRADVLLSSGTIQQRVEQLPLEGSSEQLVFASSVSLWGVIRNTQGEPIGLLLLGPRGDHDPYRAQDLRELGRLLSAAALAFTNSASFEQQGQAWRLIRRLYHRVQQIQDQTAFRIARELHHEVANAGVRINIAVLERLISRAAKTAPEFVDELEELLKNEQSVSVLIRLVCEDLVPVDPRVPMGLAASVGKTAEKATAGWEGRLQVVAERPPVAVPSHVQRELLSITHEAITNAVKHANATEIVVELLFPLQPDEQLRLSIRDNGPSRQQVEPQARHLGLHFMQESADSIGATINWLVQETGGTKVQVVAPRNGRQEQEEDAALDDWWGGEQLADEASSQDEAEVSAADRQQPPDERKQR